MIIIKSKKILLMVLVVLIALGLLSGCDSGGNGSADVSEVYSLNLKIEYLEESEMDNLNLMVGETGFSDFNDLYEDGVLTVELNNLKGENKISIAHENLNFTAEEFTVSQADADKNIPIYTTNVIVDETAGERFTLAETEARFTEAGHKYVFYPGEYVFGRDFEIDADGVTVESKTSFEDTLFDFQEDKSMKLGANNINLKGITIETIQSEDEVKYACQINQGSNNISIENNKFEGIFTQDDVSGVTIKNNKIHDGLYQGVNLGVNNSDILIEANEIYDNSWYWADKEEYGYEGIYIGEESMDVTIKDNLIRDNYAKAISLVGSTATIVNNTLQNNEYEGILFWSGSNAVVENNLIEDNKSHSIYMMENSQAEIKYNDVENNNYGIFIIGEETVANTVINDNNISKTIDSASLFTGKEDPDNPGEAIPTDNTLDAVNNWWGSSQLEANNLDVINEDEKLIIRGRVDYKPYAEEAINEAGLK